MIARIENNEVQEERAIELSEVPEHKRHIWRNVVEVKPDFDPATHRLDRFEWIIDAHRAVKSWSVTPRPEAVADQTSELETRVKVLEARIINLLKALDAPVTP
jgi:uncharacterized protein YceH (UPF0502 family)